MDWVKGVAGIPYAYLLELRDQGKYGFMLPTRDILPTAEETWQGIIAAADAIITTVWRLFEMYQLPLIAL